ncbi:MAG: DUF1934 domain-containing protein [Oscillospiraceae bacterium]|nr:DUF1934 domain-containing protein [Oscillospiraceae bacterium]
MKDNSIKVKINLKSIAVPNGDIPDVLEYVTDGTLTRIERDGREGWQIRYQDGEMTGFPGSSTELICIDDDMAQMSRVGDFTQSITMETGKHRKCDYSTEYGRMVLGVYAKHISNAITDKGGNLFLNYTLDANGILLTENRVLLTITPTSEA